MSELDVITNISSVVIMSIAAFVFIILIYRFNKQQKDSYIERTFLYGIMAALCASLAVVIFHLPYILLETLYFPFWLLGSYLYYICMGLALTFILGTGLGIKYGESSIKKGYVVLVSLFTITIAYVGGNAKQISLNQADMEMDLIGVFLVFGVLLFFLILSTSYYWMIYFETKLKNVRNMTLGMSIICFGAIGGGIGDYIGGNIAIIILDPFSFLSVLIGVVAIYNGFVQEVTT